MNGVNGRPGVCETEKQIKTDTKLNTPDGDWKTWRRWQGIRVPSKFMDVLKHERGQMGVTEGMGCVEGGVRTQTG